MVRVFGSAAALLTTASLAAQAHGEMQRHPGGGLTLQLHRVAPVVGDAFRPKSYSRRRLMENADGGSVVPLNLGLGCVLSCCLNEERMRN